MTSAAPTAREGSFVDRVRRLAGELCARDAWSRERLVAHQESQLRSLLAHAAARSAYYGEIVGDPATPLAELPTLPKSTFVEQFDRIVTDPRLRLSQLEAHLAGPHAAEPYLGRYRAFSTSGTTGLRGIIVFTTHEFGVWIAASLRALARIGIGPETRFVAVGAPSPLHVTNQLFAAFQDSRRDAPRLSVATPMAELVATLNAYQAEAVLTYASFAGMLAGEQAEGRLRISPRRVVTTSEPLTDPIRRQIEETWGVRPHEGYAATEAPPLATSAAEHDDLLVNDDLLVLEIVDDANRPVPAGTPGSKVLLTNLVNRAVPLIRYELSDSVTASIAHPPLPYPYRRLAHVEGRSVDVLHLPGANGREVAVHPFRLGTRFARLHDVRQFQVVHDERGLAIRIVARPTAPADLPARVRDEVVAELVEAGAAPPRVEVELVDVLEREPGPAGKLKLVQSTLLRSLG
jgi:phenylacetate-coenzyme A ligase PaaK-like adenylate-forming protein